MPLDRTRERIPHQPLHIILTQILHLPLLQRMPLPTAGDILVLVVDLIVQERHDQTRRRARRPALLPFIAPHRIIRIQRPLAILVHTP